MKIITIAQRSEMDNESVPGRQKCGCCESGIPTWVIVLKVTEFALWLTLHYAFGIGWIASFFITLAIALGMLAVIGWMRLLKQKGERDEEFCKFCGSGRTI